jgi:hypothetical protein
MAVHTAELISPSPRDADRHVSVRSAEFSEPRPPGTGSRAVSPMPFLAGRCVEWKAKPAPKLDNEHPHLLGCWRTNRGCPGELNPTCELLSNPNQ